MCQFRYPYFPWKYTIGNKLLGASLRLRDRASNGQAPAWAEALRTNVPLRIRRSLLRRQ